MIIDNIIIVVILIMIKGILTAVETSIACANHGKVKQKAEKGENSYVFIQMAIENPDKYITTVKTVNTTIIILIGTLTPYFFANRISSYLSSTYIEFMALSKIQYIVIFLLVIIFSYFLLLFGSLIPTKIAMKRPEYVLKIFLKPLDICYYFTFPLIKFLSYSANFFVKILGLTPNVNDDDITEEEILMMVNVSEESGMIDEDEKEMINNIFQFNNKTVGEIATHRKNIVAIPIGATIEEVMDIVIFEKFSRIPVYEENIDNIIGILYIKDFFKYWVTHRDSEFDMRAILMKPLFVPSSKKTDELFDELIAKKIHFSIIVDEYGGTAGIVTLEDLIEEIMGDIFDEYDAETRPEILKLDENTFVIDGTASLDDVSEKLNISLPIDEYDTLSGFLIAQLGHIPSESEQHEIEFDKFLFKIEKMENKIISFVKACRI